MIKFYDSTGTVHFGQANITRKTSVNGGLSLTGEVFDGDDVLNGLDYGWWLNFDNEKYVITYKKLSDDTNTVVFDAVQQFFWDFAKVALHSQYTGSHEYKFYLNQLFNGSGYTYKNDATVPAFEKENWGYKNKLSLFNDIIDQSDVEFEVHNETVHIAKQIGSDLTSFVRKGINLSDLTEEMKISDFATYAKGYGAFKDDNDQSKGRLEVEYRSELAKQFGDLEMDPIVDERYTVADNLIAALKKQVDATYTVSMTMNIYDLENAGYPNYEAPKVGDWILAIDEALNFKRKIRIIQLEEQFDVTGKRIGYTAICGDLNIVDQYTHLQISLDSKVQRIQKSVDATATSANGKNTNYYGAKEPVNANEGDLWFDQSNNDPDKWSIKQWLNGRWEQITLNPDEVDAKVDVASKQAIAAGSQAVSQAMLSMSDKIDLQVYNAKNGNLLRNSEMITDKYWTKTGNHSFWPFDPKKTSSGVPSVWIMAAGAGAKTGGRLTTEFKADGLTKNDKVTLSFYARGTAGTQLTFTLNGTTLDTYTVTLTATRTYYTVSLVYDTGNKLSIFADRADNAIMVDSLMLVKGDTAMPWEPAGDNVLTRIYMDDSDVLIQGKHIHLDGETTIDAAIIKSAMIDTVSANKLTAGTIDANNINVIHINGQNITANSITADKLSADAIQVGLNNLGSVIRINPASLDFYNGGQRSMSLQKDGMHIIDYLNGEDVGLIHVNRIKGHDNVNGLEFDLNKNGDYMAWGVRNDDISDYDVKLIWRNAYTASLSTGFQGFEFFDDVKVAFNKTLHVHTIDSTDIWPEINVNDTLNVNGDLKVGSEYTACLSKIGTNYATRRYIAFDNMDVGNTPGVLIGSTSGHGILIGDDAIYLVFGGGTYNMWDVIHSIGRNKIWS